MEEYSKGWGRINPCADQHLVNYRQMQLEGMREYLYCGRRLVCIRNSDYRHAIAPHDHRVLEHYERTLLLLCRHLPLANSQLNTSHLH